MKFTNQTSELLQTTDVIDNQAGAEASFDKESIGRDVASVVDMLFDIHSALKTSIPGPRTAASALAASKLVAQPVVQTPATDVERDAENDAIMNAKRMLECSICQDVFTNATETECCGQIYCRDCIKTWTDETASSCPMCRTELTFSMLKPARHAQRMANELTVACHFCDTPVKKGSLTDHLVSCAQAPMEVATSTTLVLQRILVALGQGSLPDFRHFLTSPMPPQAEMTQCYIRCCHNVFELIAVDGDLCLATAVRSGSADRSSIAIVISMPGNDGEIIEVGRLRHDVDSQQYTLEATAPMLDNSEVWDVTEMAAVEFMQDDENSPKKMIAVIPTVTELAGNDNVMNQSGISVSEWAQTPHAANASIGMINKPPVWISDLGAYCLDFGGRVKVASEKNFILCQPDNLESSLLIFGQTHDRNVFAMDFAHPLSPLQAFSIALSTIDSPTL